MHAFLLVHQGQVEVVHVAHSVDHLVGVGLGLAIEDSGDNHVSAHISQVDEVVTGWSELGTPQLLLEEREEQILITLDVGNGDARESLDSGLELRSIVVVVEFVEAEAVSIDVLELSSSEGCEGGNLVVKLELGVVINL